MRFGSVDTFMEFGDWGFRIGRPIANETFLKALLTYGTYDSYEFFCPDVYHMERFSSKLKEMVNDPHLLSRVRPALQIALSEAIREKGYDIFHLGDFTYFMPYLAIMRNLYAKSPFPITGVTHSLDSIHMNLRYLELIHAGLAPYDGIICTSECAKETVKKGLSYVSERLNNKTYKGLENKARLKKIPLGIEDTFFNEIDKASARKYFSIPDDMIIALSVGRLSIRKKSDYSPVLELLARMHAQQDIDRLILLIAGGADDTDVSLLESLIDRLGLKHRVIIFPNFPPDLKSRLYHAADFYISIVDNFQETFGLNIIEAMASGLPVIASDFSGYRELVENNKNGFLIPTIWPDALPDFLNEGLGILDPSVTRLYLSQTLAVDLNELEHTIRSLYENSRLRKSMGLISKKMALRYHWEWVIKSYEDFWKKLSGEAGNAKNTKPTYGSDILAGNYSRQFSHYPSRILSDSDIFSLTEVGRNVLKGAYKFIKYGDVSPSLFPELEALILILVSEKDQSAMSLKRQALARLDATEGQTSFHLQWLLKHGALRLANPPNRL